MEAVAAAARAIKAGEIELAIAAARMMTARRLSWARTGGRFSVRPKFSTPTSAAIRIRSR